MPDIGLVEVHESEDDDVGWATGHVEPALMVLSLVAERMSNVGADEAMTTLLGGPVMYADVDGNPRRTFTDQMQRAASILASVRHVWLVQDPDNDELMHEADESAEGASPFTRVEIPW